MHNLLRLVVSTNNCAGVSQLEARPNLEARIAFDLAAGQAPYSYSVAQLLGDES